MTNAALFIQGEWKTGSGPTLISKNPATNTPLWEANTAGAKEVDMAIHAAKDAFASWCVLPVETRVSFIQAFKAQLEQHQKELATLIAKETGKTLWDSTGEVKAMIGKVAISLEAFQQRTGTQQKDLNGIQAFTRHKPHGVLAVFGPYNFPGHLPNGHIVPALIAGNTIVFKPSEITPAVAEKTVQLWEAAGLPAGVLNLVQGAKETGIALSQHSEIDGLLFTGSSQTGKLLHQQFGGHPDKLLALEMGGNNPLVIGKVQNIPAAAYMTIQSAFITSGQRCTCARRLMVPNTPEGDQFLDELVKQAQKIQVGAYDESPEPFMGPVVSMDVANQLLAFQEKLIQQGATPLLRMENIKPGLPFVSPGIIDVTQVSDREDEEKFGPLLQVVRTSSWEESLKEANQTQYGLSAGILSDEQHEYESFYAHSRAGIVNWNRPLTGASSAAPFGGIGSSGNHRPSAYYAADYCSFPVASLETSDLSVPETLSPGLSL